MQEDDPFDRMQAKLWLEDRGPEQRNLPLLFADCFPGVAKVDVLPKTDPLTQTEFDSTEIIV